MNPEESEPFNPSMGATTELSLRVSIAALVRVIFEHPKDGRIMLALERRATVHEADTGRVVGVKSQPFGGALRIQDLRPLQNIIGIFHFDSEESHKEQDFRIFIRPADWEVVRKFCLEHLGQPNDPVLESDPTRELTEEFADTLGIRLERDQYICHAVGTIMEDQPSATENIHARGYPTARIYRIFEAHIVDPSLIFAMIKHSEGCSDQDLRERALEDSQNDGPGRANSVLTLPFREISAFYLTIPLEARNTPISFYNHRLDETVAAVLDNLTVSKYRRF